MAASAHGQYHVYQTSPSVHYSRAYCNRCGYKHICTPTQLPWELALPYFICASIWESSCLCISDDTELVELATKTILKKTNSRLFATLQLHTKPLSAHKLTCTAFFPRWHRHLTHALTFQTVHCGTRYSPTPHTTSTHCRTAPNNHYRTHTIQKIC